MASCNKCIHAKVCFIKQRLDWLKDDVSARYADEKKLSLEVYKAMAAGCLNYKAEEA